MNADIRAHDHLPHLGDCATHPSEPRYVTLAALLLLAGILARQADELALAYAPWLAIRVADEEDGWILMTGRSKA